MSKTPLLARKPALRLDDCCEDKLVHTLEYPADTPGSAGILHGDTVVVWDAAAANPLEAEAAWLCAARPQAASRGPAPQPSPAVGTAVSLRRSTGLKVAYVPASVHVTCIAPNEVRDAASIVIDCPPLFVGAGPGGSGSGSSREGSAAASAGPLPRPGDKQLISELLSSQWHDLVVGIGSVIHFQWAGKLFAAVVDGASPRPNPPTGHTYLRIVAGTTSIVWAADVAATTAAATARAAASAAAAGLSPRTPTSGGAGAAGGRGAVSSPATPGATSNAAFLSPWKSPPATPASPAPTATTPAAKAMASPLTPWKVATATPTPTAPATPTAAAVSTPSKQEQEIETSGADNVASAPATPIPHTTPAAAVQAAGPAAVTARSHVAGLEAPLALLRELVILPLTHKDLFAAMNLQAPKGLLLYGPPGCGKTLLVRSIVQEATAVLGAAAVRLTAVAGPELVSPVIGASEAALRALFADAHAHAASVSDGRGLSIIFLDELDALCPRRAVPGGRVGGAGGSAAASSNSPILTRLVTQLLTLMDGAVAADSLPGASGRVIVIGATNRPDALDPALRRPGRLEKEVRIDPPSTAARTAILRTLTAGMPLSPAAITALPSIAHACVGYVGADLAALAREAAESARKRHMHMHSAASASVVVEQVQPADFEQAMVRVGASSLRDTLTSPATGGAMITGGGGDGDGNKPLPAAAPTSPWASIGGMDDTIAKLREAVEYPLQHTAAYARMGLSPPRGVLLYGPPGCSKTSLVRALAASLGAAFFSLTVADVLSPYVGDAEKTLRSVFARAREAVPAIVFLDEIDSILGSRGIGGSGAGADTSTSLLATVLTEMDGVQSADGVLVIAATNRPHALDPALLRPGRLELHLHVPLPAAQGRVDILRVHTRRMPLQVTASAEVADAAAALCVPVPAAASGPATHTERLLAVLAAATDGWSGAQLENLCREAGMEALRDVLRAQLAATATAAATAAAAEAAEGPHDPASSEEAAAVHAATVRAPHFVAAYKKLQPMVRGSGKRWK